MIRNTDLSFTFLDYGSPQAKWLNLPVQHQEVVLASREHRGGLISELGCHHLLDCPKPNAPRQHQSPPNHL